MTEKAGCNGGHDRPSRSICTYIVVFVFGAEGLARINSSHIGSLRIVVLGGVGKDWEAQVVLDPHAAGLSHAGEDYGGESQERGTSGELHGVCGVVCLCR